MGLRSIVLFSFLCLSYSSKSSVCSLPELPSSGGVVRDGVTEAKRKSSHSAASLSKVCKVATAWDGSLPVS